MYGANLQTIPPGVDGYQALRELQERVAGSRGPAAGSAEASIPYLRSEHFLVRFLIARQWDVEKTVALLQGHYRWLAEVNIQGLLNDPFPEEAHIKLFYPQNYHGVDKIGRPVYIERPGLIDMPRLLQVVTPERLLQYMYAGTELTIRQRLPACSLARGEVVDKTLNIMDLSGLSFRVVTHTTARRVLRDFVVTLQNHYPETSGRMIIINAPKVFSIAWSFVKPMLDEKTVSKISIFGTDPATYTEVLLELIDAEQLPKLFGGRCLCDGHDMASCMRSSKGPWTDEEVMSVLETRGLDRIMTPEGSKLLLQMRTNSQLDEETSDVPAIVDQSDVASLWSAAAPASLASAEAFCEAEEGPNMPAPVSTDESLGPSQSAEALSEAMEISNAELEVALLREECHHHEEMHLKAIHEWVHESNSLVESIGRLVIDRAQGYYDSLSLYQQALTGQAKQQEEADQVDCELEKATVNLEMAEAALQACLAGNADALSEAQWERLAPLPDDNYAVATARVEPNADAGCDLLRRLELDANLRRSLRVSTLTDRVDSLRSQHQVVSTELQTAKEEAELARRRFEDIDLQHSRCGRNCSVRRAAPFFEKRQAHEDLVEAQLTMLQSVERRLHQATAHLATLRSTRMCRTLSDSSEMDLESFEISGAAPRDDEYLSCDSDISDEA